MKKHIYWLVLAMAFTATAAPAINTVNPSNISWVWSNAAPTCATISNVAVQVVYDHIELLDPLVDASDKISDQCIKEAGLTGTVKAHFQKLAAFGKRLLHKSAAIADTAINSRQVFHVVVSFDLTPAGGQALGQLHTVQDYSALGASMPQLQLNNVATFRAAFNTQQAALNAMFQADRSTLLALHDAGVNARLEYVDPAGRVIARQFLGVGIPNTGHQVFNAGLACDGAASVKVVRVVFSPVLGLSQDQVGTPTADSPITVQTVRD